MLYTTFYLMLFIREVIDNCATDMSVITYYLKNTLCKLFTITLTLTLLLGTTVKDKDNI